MPFFVLLLLILNISLFVSFLAICFKATKLIRVNLGLWSSVIFVIGLLSFIGNANSRTAVQKVNGTDVAKWEFNKADSLDGKMSVPVFVKLDKSFLSEDVLVIFYGRDKKEKRNVPVLAYSNSPGFTFGTKWRPISIVVNPTRNNNQFQYIVVGLVDWSLLGVNFYAQPKTYRGLAPLT